MKREVSTSNGRIHAKGKMRPEFGGRDSLGGDCRKALIPKIIASNGKEGPPHAPGERYGGDAGSRTPDTTDMSRVL